MMIFSSRNERRNQQLAEYDISTGKIRKIDLKSGLKKSEFSISEANFYQNGYLLTIGKPDKYEKNLIQTDYEGKKINDFKRPSGSMFISSQNEIALFLQIAGRDDGTIVSSKQGNVILYDLNKNKSEYLFVDDAKAPIVWAQWSKTGKEFYYIDYQDDTWSPIKFYELTK